MQVLSDMAFQEVFTRLFRIHEKTILISRMQTRYQRVGLNRSACGRSVVGIRWKPVFFPGSSTADILFRLMKGS